jgi:ribosome-binding protein aMBF1 (putative translation factor)
MQKIIRSLSASSEPTITYERVFGDALNAERRARCATEPCKVFFFAQYAETEAPTPKNHTTIEDLVSTWDADPKRREALIEARRWLTTRSSEDGAQTIRTLRLKKGWSQARLASELGTSQPHIARIERGTENVTIDTCRRLSAALEIDMNNVDQALRNQELNAARKSTR